MHEQSEAAEQAVEREGLANERSDERPDGRDDVEERHTRASAGSDDAHADERERLGALRLEFADPADLRFILAAHEHRIPPAAARALFDEARVPLAARLDALTTEIDRLAAEVDRRGDVLTRFTGSRYGGGIRR